MTTKDGIEEAIRHFHGESREIARNVLTSFLRTDPDRRDVTRLLAPLSGHADHDRYSALLHAHKDAPRYDDSSPGTAPSTPTAPPGGGWAPTRPVEVVVVKDQKPATDSAVLGLSRAEEGQAAALNRDDLGTRPPPTKSIEEWVLGRVRR